MTNARIAARFGHVLVVEDNSIIALQLEMVLEDLGVRQVTLAPDEKSALDALETLPVDVALVDFLLDRENSARVVAVLRERNIPHAIMTGLDSASVARESGAPLVLSKPFLPQELEAVLERLC